MKRFGLAFLLACLCFSSAVFGQSQSIQGEFIESSSPLSDGGRVTTRSEPGRRVQTTVTIASLPNNGASSNRGFSNTPTRSASTGNGASVLNGSATGAESQSGTGDGSASRYPYPANYPPNARAVVGGQSPVARTAGLPNNGNGQINTSRVQYQNNCCAPVLSLIHI